uniref:NADAR domain-containing protein n=1 Tax=Meloidogyne floridensis TaxID=298350 RepID=A0A915P3Z8_9BILA
MYKKATYFNYLLLAEEIMASNDPSTIKKLGNASTMRQRQAIGTELSCRDFDHEEWRKNKALNKMLLKIMYTVVRAKFEQNEQLFNMLIETGDACLIEASQTDLFWGIGCSMDSQKIKIIDNWRGSNHMGNLLMQLRNEFKFGCKAKKTTITKK